MAPFNLRRMSSNKSLRKRASTPPPPLPPTPPLSNLSSFDLTDGVSDQTSSSEQLSLFRGRSGDKDKVSGDGKDGRSGKKEGGGAGGGIRGLFRRRSLSRSQSQTPKEWQSSEGTAPPVPSLPSEEELGGALGLKEALPIHRRVVEVTHGYYDGAGAVEITPPDDKEEDLASLLHLVQAAGDKFASSSSGYDWTSSSSLSDHHTTPSLSPSTTFSSLSSPPSLSGFMPSPPLHDTILPKPLYSFLSHLSPTAIPLTPPTSPQRYFQPAPSESSSEDEYGWEGDEDETIWKRTSTKILAPLPVRVRSFRVSGNFRGEVEERNRTSMGAGGRRLLRLSQRRLGKTKEEVGERPRSNTRISKEVRGGGLRIVLGRMMVVRKLRRGTSIMEAIELERHTDWSSLEEEEEDEGWKDALRLFDGTVSDDVVRTPSYLNQLPTPTSIRAWLDRPSFFDSHLVHTAIEGGILVDLVRERPGTTSRIASARLTSWAIPASMVPPMTLSSERPTRESSPTIGARRGSVKGLVILTSAPITLRIPSPSIPIHKTLTPGPHLLAFSSSESLKRMEEDTLPLATLSSRSTRGSPLLSSGRMAALKKANDATATLQAEVNRLKNDAIVRREQQKVLDRERDERHRTREMEREMMRRVEEQNRRSRAMGQEGFERERSKSSSSSPSRSRSPATHFDPVANWSPSLAVPVQYQYPMMVSSGFYSQPQFANSAPTLHQPIFVQYPIVAPPHVVQPHRTLRQSKSYASLAPHSPSPSPHSPHHLPPSPIPSPNIAHSPSFLDLPPPPFPYSPFTTTRRTPTSSPARSPTSPAPHVPRASTQRTMKRTQSSPQIRKTAQAQAVLKGEGTRIGGREDRNVAFVQAW